MRLIINGGKVEFPPTCCCCGKPATTTVPVERKQTGTNLVVVKTTQTLVVRAPSCADCEKHLAFNTGSSGAQTAAAIGIGAALLVAGVVYGLLWVVGAIAGKSPQALVGGKQALDQVMGFTSVPVGLGAGLAFYARTSPKPLGPEHRSRAVPFEIDAFDATSVTLDFEDDVYAKAVAAANPGRVSKRNR